MQVYPVLVGSFSATVVYLVFIFDRNGDFSLGNGISHAYDE